MGQKQGQASTPNRARKVLKENPWWGMAKRWLVTYTQTNRALVCAENRVYMAGNRGHGPVSPRQRHFTQEGPSLEGVCFPLGRGMLSVCSVAPFWGDRWPAPEKGLPQVPWPVGIDLVWASDFTQWYPRHGPRTGRYHPGSFGPCAPGRAVGATTGDQRRLPQKNPLGESFDKQVSAPHGQCEQDGHQAVLPPAVAILCPDARRSGGDVPQCGRQQR